MKIPKRPVQEFPSAPGPQRGAKQNVNAPNGLSDMSVPPQG